METAVPPDTGSTFGATLNLGLLQTQMMVFHCGLAVLIGGMLMTIAPARSDEERASMPLGSGATLIATLALLGLVAAATFIGVNSRSGVQNINGVQWRPSTTQ